MESALIDSRRIEAFLDTLRAERGAADNTIEAYRRDLEDASAFLKAHQSSLIDAGERDLSAYLRDLTDAGAKVLLHKGMVHSKVVLIDGKQLADLMMDFDVGVGVSSSYVIKRIDSDYFEEQGP